MSIDIVAFRAECQDWQTAVACCPSGGDCAVCVARARKVAEKAPDLLAEVERLRAVLADVLSHFTERGSIGSIDNVRRSSWINVETVEQWQREATR